MIIPEIDGYGEDHASTTAVGSELPLCCATGLDYNTVFEIKLLYVILDFERYGSDQMGFRVT